MAREREPVRNKPADVIRDGSLKATIWENDGENGPYHATLFAKTYEDRDGKLRDTFSFSSSDLLRISELARSAHNRTNELRKDFKPGQRQSRAQNADRHACYDDNHEGDDSRDARREEHRSRRTSNGQSQRRDTSRDDGYYPDQSR